MICRFDDFELDPDARELRRAGRRVDIEPLAYGLLAYLIEHRDRVVTKDELLDALWPRQVVTEAALARCVMKARKAVDDDAERQSFIRTSRGHGYRFVAPVQSSASADTGGGARIVSPATTRYARSGDVSIAYQVIGSGPVDIVMVNGWISNVEIAWEHPRPRRFLERLAAFARLINFDKRGTGLSDRVGALPTLEERMDDVRAVMDAAGSEQAVLFGYSEGGPMSALFAATYPERVRGIVLCGAYVKRVRSADYPWAPTRDERLAAIAAAEKNWDQGLDVRHYAPSMAGDQGFADWLMAYWRRSASPGTAAEILRMNTDIDVAHVLPSIRVPALVMHRRGDRDSRADEGRYIARRIPGARFLELPGDDHLVWAGNMDDVLDPIEEFVLGLDPARPVDGFLVTLVGALLPDADPAFDPDALVSRYRGRREEAGDGRLLLSFDGTGRALHAAAELAAALSSADRPARVAVHVGECQRPGSTLEGRPVTTVFELAAQGPAGAVLVSRMVRDLVSGFAFENAGSAKTGTGPVPVSVLRG